LIFGILLIFDILLIFCIEFLISFLLFLIGNLLCFNSFLLDHLIISIQINLILIKISHQLLPNPNQHPLLFPKLLPHKPTNSPPNRISMQEINKYAFFLNKSRESTQKFEHIKLFILLYNIFYHFYYCF